MSEERSANFYHNSKYASTICLVGAMLYAIEKCRRGEGFSWGSIVFIFISTHMLLKTSRLEHKAQQKEKAVLRERACLPAATNSEVQMRPGFR